MDLFALDLNNLIPKAFAQELDANAQPTFGALNIENNTSTLASITLTSGSTSVAVGNKVDVEVEIKTGVYTVNEYRIVITFDPSKFTVLDAEPTVSGTQIQFLDTVFAVDGTNNKVESGKITLIAKTPTGNALQVNRKVARISLQAQATGNSTLTLTSSGEGSKLINQNGVAIANTLNSVTINIGSTGQSTGSISRASVSSSSRASSASSLPTIIPDTALADDILNSLPLILGGLFVILGVNLTRNRRKHE